MSGALIHRAKITQGIKLNFHKAFLWFYKTILGAMLKQQKKAGMLQQIESITTSTHVSLVYSN